MTEDPHSQSDADGRENCHVHPADENRDTRGRFLPGNRAARGRGDPKLVEMMREHRRALASALTPDEARLVLRSLAWKAAKGDAAAARVVFSYLAGPPVASDVLDELHRFEEALDAILESPVRMNEDERIAAIRAAVDEMRKSTAAATRGGAADVHDAGDSEENPEEGEA